MTRLDKPVKRVSYTLVRNGSKPGPIVVELLPGDVILLRKQRQRTGYMIDIASVWSMAVKLAARKLAADRKAARKAKKGG